MKNLKTNFDISNKSIQVTCIYLKTVLHRYQRFCNESRAATSIKSKGHALKSVKANKSISNCYHMLAESSQNIRYQRLQKNSLLSIKMSLAFKRVINNLFHHSIDCKKREEIQNYIENLRIKINEKNIRLFLHRFSNKKNKYPNEKNKN